jgi:hypothetical protein
VSTDAEAARLFLRNLLLKEPDAIRGKFPLVAPVFAPREQIRLKLGAKIPISPKGGTNGSSSPRRGTQSPQGRNPVPPARALSQARPGAARGNYTTSYIPVREKENGMNISGRLQGVAVLVFLLLALIAISYVLDHRDSKQNKTETARIKTELDARERAAGISRIEALAIRETAEAEARKRELGRTSSTMATAPVSRAGAGSACGDVVSISSSTTIGPGCSRLRIDFLVTNMYGNLISMQTPFGSCGVAKECLPLINRMRELPDNNRVITVMVPEGSFTFVN